METVNEIKSLVSKQQLPEQETLDLLGKYVRAKREEGCDENILLLELFKYGYICGQRAERKKKV